MHKRSKKIALPAMLALGVISIGTATDANARVTNFEITAKSTAFEGMPFPAIGTYDRIDAKATFAVDPNSPRVANIVDIDKVPVNQQGEIVFSTEVSILQPTDANKKSGLLFYEVPNRGRNLSFMLLNRSASSDIPAKAGDAGDGFLMLRGDTVVWSGWQSDLPASAINLDLPVLEDITGPSREQFIFDKPGTTGKGTLTYPAADLDPTKATLTVRENENDPRTTPAGLSFTYISPTEIEITRPEGMDAGAIYDFVYPAKNPVPQGLSFVATSDVISFLRGNPGHDARDPLTGIKHTVGLGISQSGRFLRDFIYQGFNADETGAKVFDGAMAHIAGSRKTFTNYRFAQPGRYSRQHEDHDYPGDQFPFTYTETTDPLTGKQDSILDACEKTDTCPKIIHTDTSTEFWQARASLVTTSPDGKPLEMPENVRLYFIEGAPHFNGWATESKMDPVCRYPTNPLSAAPVMRALYARMADWITTGKTPPASRYPNLKDGTLTPLADFKMPKFGDTAPVPAYNTLQVMDHSAVPPKRGATYPAYVPPVDANGNPTGGVALPYVAAPLGTYAGWNLRNDGYAPGELCSLTGLFVPFENNASADGRKSLAQHYQNQTGYLDNVRAASQNLIRQGYMLPDDIDYVMDKARAQSVSLHN
ncbi:alpha/beta hydrolase domain-containing protein [Thalassospira sp. MCCC 1A01428]|uniref:alpha/beta hydrolase domain-containing protein n=1 Tax=Thalassospira sp. MCCC 1A01428 TaxID=1470575 RepID=UPI000A1EE5A6|nr:alpha/beta hydrolase domain-containing protein [Thalassospira sp. MCCC 1A01428]